MWLSISGAMMVGTVAAVFGAVSSQRRRPFPVALLLALVVTLTLEAVLLDVLSAFRAVTRAGVLGAHAAACAGALGWAWRRGWRPAGLRDVARRAAHALRGIGLAGLLLAPLAILLLVSAVRFAPSNFDSMTYHLARVAHWIQQGSVEPYPTHVLRQVLLTPGAEYLLAALQVVAGSDRLAALVQFGAWTALVLAAPALARLAGAPRRLAPWAAAVVAAIPMGALQASSTQNDLVAAAAAVGVVLAALPFLHRRPGGWRFGDALVLSLALAAAALVKVTAVVAAAPVFGVVLVRLALQAFSGPGRRRALGAIGIAAVIAAVVLGPEIVRRSRPDLAGRTAGVTRYLYRGVEAFPDRLVNLARGLVRHVPTPRSGVEAVGIATGGWCRSGDLLCHESLGRPHEDFAGNPLHVALAVAAGAVALARRRRLPARAAVALGAAAAAWIAFHLVFRDNVWISRLETPTFVLTGIALAAWAGAAGPALERGRLAIAAFAVLAVAYATAVALRNDTRPPLAGAEPGIAAGYYVNNPPIQPFHDTVLAAASDTGCRRLGLFISEDAYDYPLTWRAMEAGIEVRHVFGEDPWPCLVFTGPRPPPAPLAALRWIPTGVPFLYLNASAIPTR